MARDTQALLLRRWGSAPAAVLESVADAGLVRSEGFTEDYGIDLSWSVGLFNQLIKEITGRFVELGERGILEWDADQRYVHPAFCTGSDGNLYGSVQSSGGDNASQNPTTDTNDTYWRMFELTVPESTTSQRGTIELSTLAEVRAGTDTERAVSPLNFKTVLDERISAAIG